MPRCRPHSRYGGISADSISIGQRIQGIGTVQHCGTVEPLRGSLLVFGCTSVGFQHLCQLLLGVSIILFGYSKVEFEGSFNPRSHFGASRR